MGEVGENKVKAACDGCPKYSASDPRPLSEEALNPYKENSTCDRISQVDDGDPIKE
jgi:hypothetical protein